MNLSHERHMKRTCFIIGKRPPPVTGTVMWAQIVNDSPYWDSWRPILFNINLNRTISDIGSISIKKYLKTSYLFRDYIVALRRTRPEVVVVPLSQSLRAFSRDAAFLLLAKIFRSKVLVYLHGSAFKEDVIITSRLLRPLVVGALRRASAAVVLGESLKNIFIDILPSDSTFVIYNGIDIPTVGEYELHGNVLYLGNLIATKGIEDFIRAGIDLKVNHPNLEFNIVGEIGDKPSEILLESAVRDGYVTYLGPKFGEEKLNIMRSSDILVFPPRAKEGQPLVLIEAMAVGLAIITTPMGGIPETVGNGKGAILVPPQSPNAIAEAIRDLYANPMKMKNLRENARALYEERYTEQRMIQSLENVLQQIYCGSESKAVDASA